MRVIKASVPSNTPLIQTSSIIRTIGKNNNNPKNTPITTRIRFSIIICKKSSKREAPMALLITISSDCLTEFATFNVTILIAGIINKIKSTAGTP